MEHISGSTQTSPPQENGAATYCECDSSTLARERPLGASSTHQLRRSARFGAWAVVPPNARKGLSVGRQHRAASCWRVSGESVATGVVFSFPPLLFDSGVRTVVACLECQGGE